MFKVQSLSKWIPVLVSSLVVVGYLVSHHMISSKDPEFHFSRLGTRWKGELYTGLTYQFHSNGQFYKLQFFKNGKQVGTEHRWYSNGVKWEEISFRDGLNHGASKMWYSNGNVKALRHYVDGEPHGEFWGWHVNGVVSDYHVFSMGKQLVYKSFISDGQPFYNYVYSDGKAIGLRAGNFCKTKKL